MKLTLFLVVLGFCYCVSYESIDVGPGSLEVASMADENYGDFRQRQLERDSTIDPSSNSILDMRKRHLKNQSKPCAEKPGGCLSFFPRGFRSDPELVFVPPLIQNEISEPSSSKRQEKLKVSCPQESGGCSPTYIARYIRSDSLQTNSAQSPHTDPLPKMKGIRCLEKVGSCTFFTIRALRSGIPFSTVVEKNMDYSPDYSDNDYQS